MNLTVYLKDGQKIECDGAELAIDNKFLKLYWNKTKTIKTTKRFLWWKWEVVEEEPYKELVMYVREENVEKAI